MGKAKSKHDSWHHLVPKSVLEYVFGLNNAHHIDRATTDINNLFFLNKTRHTLFHELFNCRTMITIFWDASKLYERFQAEDIRGKYDVSKLDLWKELFGQDADADAVARKMRYLVWYYLFSKKPRENNSRQSLVYSPSDILSTEFDSKNDLLTGIFDKQVPNSVFKKQAWQILFSQAIPGDISLSRLHDIWESCDSDL
jgi:hypothetical protein